MDRRLLYVGGLDDSVTVDVLRSVFIPFGDLIDVQLSLDSRTGEKKGFGFVEFETSDDAAAAMDNMNQAELYGRTLHVNYARPGLGLADEPMWADTDKWLAETNKAKPTEPTSDGEEDLEEPAHKKMKHN